MTDLVKSLLLRFVRGTVAGAIGNMLVVLPFAGSNWKDIKVWLGVLIMSGIVGAISGLILTADKYLRSE